MSNCCKCAKWLPHNWLCLKGLSVLFLVFFYVALVYAVFQACAIFSHPALQGREMWLAAAYYVASDLAAAIGFLTVAKVLKAVKILKDAVTYYDDCGCEDDACCCGEEHGEECGCEEGEAHQEAAAQEHTEEASK